MSRKKKDPAPQDSAPQAVVETVEAQPSAPVWEPVPERAPVPEGPLTGKVVTDIRLVGTLINIFEDNRSNARAEAAEQLVRIIEKARERSVESGIEPLRLHDRLVALALENSTMHKDRVRFVALAMSLE